MANRHEEYTRIVRQKAITLWQVQQDLKGLQAEWDAQDYTNTLVIDSGGDNADVTVPQLAAVVHDTTNAIETLMDNGHATNITNLLQ